MQSFIVLFRTKLREYAAYRINFVLWRVRGVFSLLLTYYLWDAVTRSTIEVSSYTTSMIFTYIFLAAIVNSIVLSNRLDQIAGDILNGAIINQLLKPIHFFQYVSSREIADKAVNVGFSLLEVGVFILILSPPLQAPAGVPAILIALLFLFIAILLSFFISLSLSLIAFWSTEIWAPRFIFFVLISLAAGTMFPIDILPEPLYLLSLLTPFPYMVYVPVKLWLFGVVPELPLMLGVSIIWTGIAAGACYAMWHKGLREFSFFGR